MPIVELFYDLISPYSRIQHGLLMKQLGHWKTMQLTMTPVMIRKVFECAENLPPALIPRKALYNHRDLKAISEFHKIPFKIPRNFVELALEFKVDPAQLYLCAIKEHLDDDVYNRLVGKFYENFFKENYEEIWNKDFMIKVSTELGISSDIIEKALNEMENKQTEEKLEKNSKRVDELGGFGLPITLLHLEKPKWIFGSDRMHIIGQMMNEKPPILQ